MHTYCSNHDLKTKLYQHHSTMFAHHYNLFQFVALKCDYYCVYFVIILCFSFYSSKTSHMRQSVFATKRFYFFPHIINSLHATIINLIDFILLKFNVFCYFDDFVYERKREPKRIDNRCCCCCNVNYDLI